MNKVYLIGNLTKDPETAQTQNGISVCKFDIAVSSGFGEHKTTDYFKIIAWRGQAETCAKYLKKGSKVAVIGELHNRTYEDRNGAKKFVTEITANEIEFLSVQKTESKDEKPIDMIPFDEEDLPF